MADAIMARCMKCRKQVAAVSTETVTLKNGMAAVKGKCPDCGTTVFKILGKKK